MCFRFHNLLLESWRIRKAHKCWLGGATRWFPEELWVLGGGEVSCLSSLERLCCGLRILRLFLRLKGARLGGVRVGG